MVINDSNNAGKATAPNPGTTEPGSGANNSSDTFTDMPSLPSDTEGNHDKAAEQPADDKKIDIASADDVDLDKDLPETGETHGKV